ncbi:MAG: GIY-YIG nuclease family protein [Patescibacteria group bacterium]
MYYIYLIRNSKTQRTYIGYTKDLKRRIREHQNKKPELIYCEAYKDEIDAREREYKLKQRGQTVRRLKERLKNSLNQAHK